MSRRTLSKIAGFLICFCLPQCCLAAPSGAQSEKFVPALKLTQSHYYYDLIELIECPQGLRLTNRGRMRFALVARPPLWDVTVFRDDDKTCYQASLKQFESTGLVSDFVLKWQGDSSRMKGIKSTVTIGKTAVMDYHTERDDFAYLPLWQAGSPVERIMRSVYKLPTNGGIPVKFTRVLSGSDRMTGLDVTGSRRVYLTTKKIENVRVNTAIFAPPAGYKKCRSLQEVLLSKSIRDSAEDMDEMFDIGKGPDKSHGK